MALSLTVSKDVLVADGRDFAVVTATVRGPDGRPAPNQDVFFAIADESGRFADIGVIVGSNGPGTGATVRTNAAGRGPGPLRGARRARTRRRTRPCSCMARAGG